MFENRDIIHSYSRAQAILDGLLIDASALAREAGFRYDVALTRAAWERCVAVPEGVTCQSEEARLWDVIHLLAAAIRRGGDGAEVQAVFGLKRLSPPTLGRPPASSPWLTRRGRRQDDHRRRTGRCAGP